MSKLLEELLFLTMALYFAFYFLRALVTGRAQIWRKRPPTARSESPKHYWLFTVGMAAGAIMLVWLGTVANSN